MLGIIEQDIFSPARFLRVKGSKRTVKTEEKRTPVSEIYWRNTGFNWIGELQMALNTV